MWRELNCVLFSWQGNVIHEENTITETHRHTQTCIQTQTDRRTGTQTQRHSCIPIHRRSDTSFRTITNVKQRQVSRWVTVRE